MQAKNKQVQGTNLQNALIEAQSMIETMQAYPQADLEQLLEVEKSMRIIIKKIIFLLK